MKDKIKELLFGNGRLNGARSEAWMKAKYPEEYEWLMGQFPEYTDFPNKAKAVYHGSVCRCSVCKAVIPFGKRYCSVECTRIGKANNAVRTNQERYGSDWPMQDNGVMAKSIETNRKKYGTDHRLQNADELNKHKQTMNALYGSPYAMQVPELKERNTISKLKPVINVDDCQTYEDAKRKYLASVGVYLRNVPFAVGTPSTKMMSADVARIYANEHKFNWSVMQRSYKDFYGAARKYGVRAADQGKSVPERQLLEFAKTVSKCKANVRDVITGMELDVYLPDYGLALEFNGLYWHDYFNGKPKDYHMKKTQACLNAGIRLIHVWEDHWKNHQEIVKFLIMRACGMGTRIDANECTVTPTNRIAAGQFYSNNAILSWKESRWHLVLCANHTPVAMISYSVFESIATVDMYAMASGVIVDGALNTFLKYIWESHPTVRTMHMTVPIDTVHYMEIERCGFVPTSSPKPYPRLVNKKTMQPAQIDNSFPLKEILNFPNEFDEKSSNFVIKLLKESCFLLYNAGNLTMEMKDGKCNDNCRKDPGTIRV